ncbi:related to WD-repeat protein CRB3 [Cephalotrichum gorgonifer]|uniref:Pre-rRNA-processing protein IPI3 n=1 Tax=Cephalotrichum gorgonifer TaxID=2041049 RepID=A0AAE8MTV5_9PEZI|nr:related to WD-repeat protein CRB3 [Cephalotrichum gorgonifer]
MLSETFFASVGGPPLASRTEVAKDVGIYSYELNPALSLKSTFKKSSTSPNCLAVSETHVFAGQKDKAHVHVYSRAKGNQEALIPFPEKITSLALTEDVLLIGTAQGRLTLWELCTGRQVTTPPCHVQAVTCLAATPYHVLTGSDDSNVHVWALPHLLDLDARADHEPEQTLSNHRAAVTSVVVSKSTNPETSICISASKDKTCIIWNYRTGEALRTLLFQSAPLCMSLDSCARAVFAATEDGSVFAVEMFGDKALLGPRSEGLSSAAVQVTAPLGVVDPEDGPACCIATSFDGTALVTGHSKGKIFQWSLGGDGHPTRLADLNASVNNVVFTPLLSETRTSSLQTVVKPTRAERQYTFTAQLETSLAPETRFSGMMNTMGFPSDVLEAAVLAQQQPAPTAEGAKGGAQEGGESTEELWKIINEQRELQQLTFRKFAEANKSQNPEA